MAERQTRRVVSGFVATMISLLRTLYLVYRGKIILRIVRCQRWQFTEPVDDCHFLGDDVEA